MPANRPHADEPIPKALPVSYALAVLIDLGIAWLRLLNHFTTPALIFRVYETTLKLSLLLLVLREKRWAYFVQLLLSVLALISGLALLFQTNKRPLNDPLVWVSLLAQVLAGIYCAYRFAKSFGAKADPST